MTLQSRVLVTGAAGMVGGAIVAGLRETHDIIEITRAHVDLLDATAVDELLSRVAPDIVVHAAGRVGGIEANRLANSQFLVDNARMGFNVVQAAHRAQVDRLLNFSSSCVYPRDRELLAEQDILTGPLEPTNQGYALAKISVMYLCQALSAERSETSYKTFVPCNLYGPGDHYGEGRSHLIPSAIRKVDEAIRGGVQQVPVWGDGSARREFMFVNDLVEAVRLALADWDATPDLVNLGPGHDWTVTEYYQAVAHALGYRGELVYELDRPVGMRRKLLDVRRAKEWGWSAKTSLESGLRQTVADYSLRRQAHATTGDA